MMTMETMLVVTILMIPIIFIVIFLFGGEINSSKISDELSNENKEEINEVIIDNVPSRQKTLKNNVNKEVNF